MEQTKALDEARRSPQGERGLKYKSDVEEMVAARRSPQGERGLKYRCSVVEVISAESLPARGAWIEIPTPSGYY